MIIHILFKSFFFGFIVWTFVRIISARSLFFGFQKEVIDNFVIRTVILFGMIHMAFFMLNFFRWNEELVFNKGIEERAFGEYWFSFWLYPFTYFGLTQLLWVRSICKQEWIRVGIALWILIVMHAESFIILMVSLNRDFSPGTNFENALYAVQKIVMDWVMGLLIFVAFTAIGIHVRGVKSQT